MPTDEIADDADVNVAVNVHHQIVKIHHGKDGESHPTTDEDPLPMHDRAMFELLKQILAEIKLMNFQLSQVTSFTEYEDLQEIDN